MANIALKDLQFPGLNNVYKIPEVDNTLTQSGAAADAKKTGDELSDLKQELNQNIGTIALPKSSSGLFIATNGTTVDVSNIRTTTDPFRYSVFECSEGDIFTISGKGGETPRLWAFCDASNNIIAKSAGSVEVEDYTIVAPPNTAFIVINDKENKVSFKNVPLNANVPYLRNGFVGDNSAKTASEYSDYVNTNYLGKVLVNANIESTYGNYVYVKGIGSTLDYIPQGVAIIPMNGYYASLAYYDQNDAFVGKTLFSNHVQFMDSAYKYKLLFRRTETSTIISENEINNIIIATSGSNPMKWEHSLINSNTGVSSYSPKELRTLSFVPETVKSVGVTSAAYGTSIARYNKSTLAFVDRSLFTQALKEFDHSQYKYVILFNRSDNGDISISEAENCVITYNDDSIKFAGGLIGTNGAIQYVSHAMMTTDFIPENILGVSLASCYYELSIGRWKKSDGSFVDRLLFNTAPMFGFDHTTYKYKVMVITANQTSIQVTNANSIVRWHYTYDEMKPFANSIGISDMSSFLSGDGTQVAIDYDKGMAYVVYNAGTYGEDHTYFDLAVFPIHQPFNIKYYRALESGGTYGSLTVTVGQDCNIVLGNGYVRVMFYETGTECWWYRDFNIANKTFGDAYKMQIKFGANDTAVDFSKTNVENYYDNNSLAWDGNPTIASRFFEKDDILYGCLMPTIATTNPLFVKSEDNGATFEVVNIIPITGAIECAIAYTDKWYIIIRSGGFFYSDDDFATATRIGGSNSISCDGTRPDMFILDNEIVVCASKTRTSWSTSLHAAARTNIIMYRGGGTDISNYKVYYILLNPHGCCYYRIINFKGVLYYIGTCGELYPDKHYADAQCKDGVYYIKLGFAEALI